MELITDIAIRLGKNRFEKSFPAQTLRRDSHGRFALNNNSHLFGIWPEDSNSQFVADAMWSKDPKRIRVQTGHKRVHLIHRQSCHFKRTHNDAAF